MRKTELVVVEPHADLITPRYDARWADNALRLVEECGRVSHKSEGRIKDGSAEPFVRKVAIKWKHESILEHAVFTACFVGSRAMSHQLVRHRLAAYTQESQRYCDYSGGEEPRLHVIVPPSIVYLPEGSIVRTHKTRGTPVVETADGLPAEVHEGDAASVYLAGLLDAYWRYNRLRDLDVPSEDARHALPNAAKTEVYATFNLRQWRHVFKMRLDSHAQWEIRKCVRDVYDYFRGELPLLLEAIETLGGEQIE